VDTVTIQKRKEMYPLKNIKKRLGLRKGWDWKMKRLAAMGALLMCDDCEDHSHIRNFVLTQAFLISVGRYEDEDK